MRRFFSKLVDFVIGAALLSFAGLIIWATANAPYTNDSLYQKGRSQTFRMLDPTNLGHGGTGFAVRAPSGHVYTMTNAHVCAAAQAGALVAEQNGKSRLVRIIAANANADLCLLDGIPGYAGLKVAQEAALFEEVFIVGHPYLNPISFSAGFTNDTRIIDVSYCQSVISEQLMAALPYGEFLEGGESCMRRMSAVLTDAHSAPGNSGSATLNRQGEVVGVLFAGSPTGVSLLVPLNDVIWFLADF